MREEGNCDSNLETIGEWRKLKRFVNLSERIRVCRILNRESKENEYNEKEKE